MSDSADIRFQAVRDGDVDAALDAAIRALQQEAFPSAEPFRHSRHYKHVADKDDVRVLAWMGRRLVAQAVVLWFAGHAAGRTCKLAGIGNVCAAADCRGRGLARACLERAMELARASDAGFALLFCAARLEGFYGRFGFRAVRNEWMLTPAQGEPYPRDWHDIRMVAPMSGQTLADWPSGPIVLEADDF